MHRTLIVSVFLLFGTFTWCHISSAKLPDPTLTGNTITQADAIYLAVPSGETEDGWTYSILRSYDDNPSPGQLVGPAPPSRISPQDTLVLLVPKDLEERNRQNLVRKQHGLAQARLFPHEAFSWSETRESGLDTILTANFRPDDEFVPLLRGIFLADPSSWRGAVAETVLLNRLVINMMEHPSRYTERKVAELYAYRFSPITHSTATTIIEMNYPQGALATLFAIMDTCSLNGENAELYSKNWYLVKVLLSWPDKRSVLKVDERISGELFRITEEDTIASRNISKSIMSLYVENRQKSDVPLTAIEDTLRIHFKDSREVQTAQYASTLEIVRAFPREKAADLFTLILHHMTFRYFENLLPGTIDRFGYAEGKKMILSLRSPLIDLAHYTSPQSVDALVRISKESLLRGTDMGRFIVESLAATDDPRAADQLIELSEKKIFRKVCLMSLAGMQSNKAVNYVLGYVRNDLETLLSSRKNRLPLKDLTSAAALNVLASRGAEYPEISDLFLGFARKAPPSVREYAVEIAINLNSEEAVDFIFDELPSMAPELFPEDLRRLDHFPSYALAPRLLDILTGDLILPQWNNRKFVYQRAASQILTNRLDDAKAEALLTLLDTTDDPAFKLMVLTTLNGTVWMVPAGRLAEIVFTPAQRWEPRLLGVALGSQTVRKDSVSRFAERGAEIIAANLGNYKPYQIQAIAQLLAESKKPEGFLPIFQVLRRSESSYVQNLASYGLSRIQMVSSTDAE